MRGTVGVLLFLVLVTAAGSVIPRFGEQRSADADIAMFDRIVESMWVKEDE